MKGYQNKVLNGNFVIQDQWENQEQDGSKSRGTHQRTVEYEGGGDE